MRWMSSWFVLLVGMMVGNAAWAADPLVASLAVGMVGMHPGSGLEVYAGVPVHGFYFRSRRQNRSPTGGRPKS